MKQLTSTQSIDNQQTFFRSLLWLVMLLAIINTALIVNKAFASEQTSASSRSLANFTHEFDDTVRKQLFSLPATDLTKSKQRLPEKLQRSSSFDRQSSDYGITATMHYQSFSIYDADSRLFDDEDYDGYYQTFSVTFDADVISGSSDQSARVYALLYLSENNGPWQHYFSTEDFVIVGDSSEDEYEVFTQLLDGYYPNDYDVLIELYHADTQVLIATLSADDSNALYALPLESSDYDEVYEDHVDVHYHGSIGLFTALFMFSVLIIRKQRKFIRNPRL
ncbi:choice-of-anchor H family protein [Thalassotalea maritima]|uniref:choice-of-anchor H family protein n=1 Tax=Thalassotalea maritima TaxID=3242416 RepID=UPI00352893F8